MAGIDIPRLSSVSPRCAGAFTVRVYFDDVFATVVRNRLRPGFQRSSSATTVHYRSSLRDWDPKVKGQSTKALARFEYRRGREVLRLCWCCTALRVSAGESCENEEE